MSIVQPLLVLQEIDARLRTLQQEARDIPIRKSQEQGRLRGALEALDQAQAGMKSAQARVNDAELDVKERRETITKLRQQQATLKTNKEFAAMNLEIATIEGQIDSCEARQVTALDGLTPAQARVAEAQGKLREQQATVDTFVKELDTRLAAVQQEIQQAETERQAVAKLVPATFLTHYSRLVGRRWPPVVPLEGQACGGCHLTQPPSVPHSVRRNATLVACQSCGRILYIP